jgi:hypothetical protein
MKRCTVAVVEVIVSAVTSTRRRASLSGAGQLCARAKPGASKTRMNRKMRDIDPNIANRLAADPRESGLTQE